MRLELCDYVGLDIWLVMTEGRLCAKGKELD